MDQGTGRDTLRPMATIKKGSSLGKDKKPTCPSKPNDSIGPGPGPGQGLRRHSLGSTLPNKSTKCPTTDASTATKNVKKTATHTSQPQRPDPLRRSAASPASAAPAQKKPLVSPGPQKPTTTTRSASFPSKLTTSSPKSTLERVAKTAIAAKLPTLSSSSRTKTKSMKAAPSPRPSIKRGTTTSSASKKPPHDKKQAKKLETNNENKENLDHQVEEVVKDVQGEIHDIQIPKAEEETQQHARFEEKYILDDVSIVTHDQQQHQKPRTEEMEDKFHEQEPDGSNSDGQHEEAKENDSEEEINVSHDEQEKLTHEETIIETEDQGVEGNTTEEVAVTEENNDDGKEQGIESVEEEANVVAQSQVEAEALDGEEEIVEGEVNLVPGSQVEAEAEDGEKETVEEEANLVPESQVEAEASEEKESIEEDANTVPESRVQAEAATAAHGKEETNMVPESQVQGEAAHEEEEKVEEKPNSVAESRVQAKAANGKNEPPTPNSDVVEVTASMLVIERKGRVRALVGAFESKW